MKEVGSLQQFGPSQAEAEMMAAAIAAAEADIDPELVEKFSRFDGVVMMEADGSHPPLRGHGSGHGHGGHANGRHGHGG